MPTKPKIKFQTSKKPMTTPKKPSMQQGGKKKC